MPKTHRPYPSEFRRHIVELVRKRRTPEELGRHFEPSAQCIRNRVRQADRDEGRRQDGLTTAEQEELRRLRRENRTLPRGQLIADLRADICTDVDHAMSMVPAGHRRLFVEM